MASGLRIYPLVAAFALFLGGEAQAQSLEQELAGLVRTHPLLKSARADLDAADQAVRRRYGAFLPQVDATGLGGYEYTDSPQRRRAGEEELDAFARQIRGTVTQSLYDGSERSGRYAIARLGRDRAESSLDSTAQSVLLDGVRAYHEVLRATKLVELSSTSEEAIRTQLNLEDERVRRGGGIEVDVLLSKARLQIAKQRRVAFEGLLRDAQARYRQAFGKDPSPATMTDPIPPLHLLPDDQQAAIARADEANPDLLSAALDTEIADRERDVAKADYYPDLDLVGSANWEDDIDGVEGVRRDLSATLRLRWNLFSGFATQAQVAGAAAEYSSQLQRQNFIRRSVTEEAELAFNELLTARERVTLLSNASEIAAQVFQARRRLREVGQESAINVLDSETELYDARINETNANYDARLASYRLVAAMGQLNPRALKLPLTNEELDISGDGAAAETSALPGEESQPIDGALSFDGTAAQTPGSLAARSLAARSLAAPPSDLLPLPQPLALLPASALAAGDVAEGSGQLAVFPSVEAEGPSLAVPSTPALR